MLYTQLTVNPGTVARGHAVIHAVDSVEHCVSNMAVWFTLKIAHTAAGSCCAWSSDIASMDPSERTLR